MIDTLKFERKENVGWLADMHHYPTEKEWVLNTPTQPRGTVNFVSLRFFHLIKENRPNDDPMVDVMEVANRVVGNRASCTLPDDKIIIGAVRTGKVGHTIIEAVTTLLPEYSESGELDTSKSISKSFDRCMEHIDEIVKAYRAITLDLHARSVNRISTFLAVPYSVRKPDSVDNHTWLSLFMANVGGSSVVPMREACGERVSESVNVAISRGRSNDPLARSADRRWAGRRALEVEGNFGSAIIECAIGVEMALNSVLLLLAWESGLSASEAAMWFRPPSTVTARVKSRYGRYIGGKWDVTDEDSIVGMWHKHVVIRRNEFVHFGKEPKESDVRTSLWAGEMLIAFLRERVIESRAKFPKTALIFVGHVNLEREGKYTKRMRRQVKESDIAGENWVREFGMWVDSVEQETRR